MGGGRTGRFDFTDNNQQRLFKTKNVMSVKGRST